MMLALVLYMLHSVVPHHHHHQLICFNINHLEASCCSDKSHHHHQDNSSSQECCTLNIPVVLNNENDELKTECSTDDSQNTSFEFGTTSNYDFDVALLLTEVVPDGEKCFSYSILQFFSAAGLRAPPTII